MFLVEGDRTQAGLEYLMTYGWALVLIATIIGVFVLVVGPAPAGVAFSSSDPAKIMLKSGGVAADGTVGVTAQNATGGEITVIAFFLGGDFVDRDGADSGAAPDATLNGAARYNFTNAGLKVPAGGLMELKGITYLGLGDVDSSIEIIYKDYFGFTKRAIIAAKGKTSATPGVKKIVACGATPVEGGLPIAIGGMYILDTDLSTATAPCLTFVTNVALNCLGKTITGPGGAATGNGITMSSTYGTVTKCTINSFQYGVSITSTYNSVNSSKLASVGAPTTRGISIGGTYASVNGNTATGNGYGIYFSSTYGSVNGNTANNNTTYGIYANSTSATNTVSFNKACGNTTRDIHCISNVDAIGMGNKANTISAATACRRFTETGAC